jgi:phosphoribosylanthranilate isomerase
VDGVAGGSGREFDRSLALGIPRVPPVYLAGGLDADNVGAAVRALRPAGVDVSSGVEAEPGVKDASSMRRFVAAVRAADEDERGDKTP